MFEDYNYWLDYFNNHDTDAIISKLIEHSEKYRYVGNAKGLIKIPINEVNNVLVKTDNIKINENHILVKHPDNDKNNEINIDNFDYDNELFKHNVVVAGGSVVNKCKGLKSDDYDLYFVGENIDEEYVKTSIMCIYKDKNIKKIWRNYNSFNVEFNDKEYYEQIILRKYSYIAEVLFGFDLSASQIAYDGEYLYFTPAFYYTYITNILFIDKHKADYYPLTYYYRLVKYYNNKKFDIIFDKNKIWIDNDKSEFQINIDSKFNSFSPYLYHEKRYIVCENLKHLYKSTLYITYDCTDDSNNNLLRTGSDKFVNLQIFNALKMLNIINNKLECNESNVLIYHSNLLNDEIFNYTASKDNINLDDLNIDDNNTLSKYTKEDYFNYCKDLYIPFMLRDTKDGHNLKHAVKEQKIIGFGYKGYNGGIMLGTY